jgi:hypothetical protein
MVAPEGSVLLAAGVAVLVGVGVDVISMAVEMGVVGGPVVIVARA